MNISVVFWILVTIVLAIIESLTFSLTCIWGALAAVLCAIIAAFGISFKISVYLFIGMTTILLLCTRPFVKHFIDKNKIPTNADRIIGAEGIITKDITRDAPGEIKVMGQFWSAVSDTEFEISEGTRVVVRSIDGVKLKVDTI